MKTRYFIFVVIFLMSSFLACQKMDVQETAQEPNEESAAVEEEAVDSQPTIDLTQGTAATIVVGDAPFSVEIAISEEERAKGLMNRESLAKDSGMWFVFPSMVQEKFWMKNTLIPLDLIFVDENMKVVYIIENAPAESTELLSSSVPYKYVLEIAGGSVEEKGIEVDDTVEKRVGSR